MSVLDDLRKTFSINAPKSMRRHCNAISKKAVYDQLFIDTIVMAQHSELSNILVKSSYMRFFVVSFFFKAYINYQINSFSYFGHSNMKYVSK